MTAWLHSRPADAGQYALWAEAAIDPMISGGGYFAVTFHGAVEERDLESAALAVLHRHEPLRSVLRLVDGQLRQFVLPAPEARYFGHAELNCEQGTERAGVRAWMERHEQRRHWDLSMEAPIRFHHLTHGVDRCSMVFAAHHAGFDGRSKFVVAQQFSKYFRDIRSGLPVQPSPLSAPVTPVASVEVVAEAISFWRKTIESRTTPMSLPEGGRLGRRSITSSPTVDLDPIAVTTLWETARKLQVSTFTMLLAALIRQLAAYDNSSPLLALASDVSDERTGHIAGLQVNVVPVAIDTGPGASTEQSVTAAQRTMSHLARFRRVPFVDLVAGLPGKPLARLGTQLGVSFPRPPAGLDLEIPGVRADWDFFTPNTSATFSRALQIRANWPDCRVRLDYRQDLMGAPEVEQFLADFRTAVSDLAANRGNSSVTPAVADRAVTVAGAGKPYTCAGVRVGTLLADDSPDPPRLVPAQGFAFTAHGPSGRPLPRSIAGSVRVRFPDGRVLSTGDCGYIAADDSVRLLGPEHGRWIGTRSLIDTSAVTRIARTHPSVQDAKVVLETARTETAVLVVTGSNPNVPTAREIRAYMREWIHGSDLPGRIHIRRPEAGTEEG